MMTPRVRAFLGVWMPFILGGLVIALAGNFIVASSTPPSGPFSRWPEGYSWDAWRAACAGGLVFIGVVLGISTFGRYQKAKAARADGEPRGPPVPPPNP